MRHLLLLIPLASCVAHVSMIEPRPNLPPRVDGQTINMVLGDAVQQETRLFRVSLDSFRGDLKRGFLNGYPGAVVGTGDLQLVLDSVEPTYARTSAACVATLRYRGRLMKDTEALESFAGVAKSEPGDFRRCFKGAIEALFEQTFRTLNPGEPEAVKSSK
ncbi:MAG: hypothetical protein Q8L48_26230 [Archangium sp.]|nr:hypothetical protein [Archangium sp.]